MNHVTVCVELHKALRLAGAAVQKGNMLEVNAVVAELKATCPDSKDPMHAFIQILKKPRDPTSYRDRFP
eukprot:6464207-Amphidinium_carterae.1